MRRRTSLPSWICTILLGREAVADLSNLLKGKLQLPPATFNQMVNQERRQIVNVLVAGVFAEIDDLSHRWTCTPGTRQL
jgi:hypothetical protein